MSEYVDPGDQVVDPPVKDSSDENQIGFWDYHFGPVPHQKHSETSKEAAEQIEPSADTYRRMVLDYLRLAGPVKVTRFGPSVEPAVHGGATNQEVQDDLQMNPSTERPRMVELVKAGLARDSGYKRPTRSGRRAVVWEAV